MKKILFIHHAAGWGGAPNSMIHLIKNLDSSAFQAEVLLLKNSVVAEKLIEQKINYSIADSIFYRKYYHYFSHSEAGYVRWYQVYKFLKLSFLWILSRFYFAKKEIAKHEYDIVHLNSSVLTDWLAPAKKKGKVVIHIREPYRKGQYDFLHPIFTKIIRKHADKIFAISRDNADRIDIPEKTSVLYNWAEIPKFEIDKNSYASKKVLYLGGVAYIKGFYTMVRALDYLDKDVKVYFGGNYLPRKKTQATIILVIKRIMNIGKEKKVALEKMRNCCNAIEIGMSNNIEGYLNEVCCLATPFSVPHFSRPAIESFLHKKPVIGSDVKGMDEIIKDGKNGIIIQKDNHIELANAINLLTSDKEMAKRLGNNGYIFAVKNFTSKNASMIQELYNELAIESFK